MNTVDSKMTALADEIRELSGTTTLKGIDAMTSDIDAANAEIAEQAVLLEQIATALEGKAAGDGGVTLPELTNPASTSDILGGKEAIDGEGNKITGTIAIMASSNLIADGATVTVPAGYYASNATKSVASVSRAETTISVTKDATNDKLTLIASNNQGTGYVTGANKTATKTVTLTTNGATATMSDGTNSVSKSVAAGSAKTPATTITKNPTISVNSSGLITTSVSGTQNITPTVSAGYVSSGTAGTITVSGSATKQLTTQAAKTITPTTSSQTAVASGVYTTGAVTVAAIPSSYVQPSGTKSITSNGTHDVKSYASVNVNVAGEDVTTETNAYTAKIGQLETAVAALESELEGKASGGSSNGVEVEVITITETDTSQIPFTLKRVTKTIGSYNGDSATGVPFVGPDIISSHINTYRFAYTSNPMGTYVNKAELLTLSSGKLVASQRTFAVPYVAVFINDPTQPAIYEE